MEIDFRYLTLQRKTTQTLSTTRTHARLRFTNGVWQCDTKNSKIISKIILPKLFCHKFISKTFPKLFHLSNFDCLLIQFFDW